MLVDVVGLADLGDGLVKSSLGSTVLELDNVLAGDELGASAGLEDGSALVNGRRGGGHGQRQESEDGRQLHGC